MTPFSTCHAGDDAGFTLVEMLVSLAILAVVAVLIAQALGGNGRALASIERRTNQGEEVAWAQSELRELVEALVPHAEFVGSEPVVVFSGAPQAAAWLALVRPPGLSPRMERVRVDLSPDGELQVATSSADGPPAFGPPRPILHGVRAMRFAFFGAQRGAATAAWRDQWVGGSDPPRAVRLDLQLEEGGRRWWPAFIARPAAMIDDACIVDPATGSCRGRT